MKWSEIQVKDRTFFGIALSYAPTWAVGVLAGILIVGVWKSLFGVTDVLAIVAIVVALITLFAVFMQIRLANEQIKIARDELRAVNEDLRYSTEAIKLAQEQATDTKEALNLAAQQAAYIARRARLELWHNRQRIELLATAIKPDSDNGALIELQLWLFNGGDNTARDAAIFLWIPPDWRIPGWTPMSNPEPFFAEQGLRVIANVQIDDKRYWYAVADVPFPTYPGVERLALRPKFWMPLGYDGDLLWRVGYDDGITPPAAEPVGRLRFKIMRSQRQA